jgi:hypothetical protein
MVPQISPALEFKLEVYYNKVIESKVKEEWTIPENLLKEKELVDLETIIIINNRTGWQNPKMVVRKKVWQCAL